MKKIIQKSVLYQCSTCKTRYTSMGSALQCEECEDRILEKKIFRVGDIVRNIEPRTCDMSKNYIFYGKVVRVLGPKPSNHEYEAKWLRGKRKRVNGHVFEYEVEFSCPHCKETKQARYYAPELELKKLMSSTSFSLFNVRAKAISFNFAECKTWRYLLINSSVSKCHVC